MKTTQGNFVSLKILTFVMLLIGFDGAFGNEPAKKMPKYSSNYYAIPFNQKISGTWYGKVKGDKKDEYADYTLSLVAYDESEYEIHKAKKSKDAKPGMVYMPETQVSGYLTINIFPKEVDGRCLPKAEFKIPLKGIFMRNHLMLHNASYSENGSMLIKVNYMIYNFVDGVLDGHYFEFAPFSGSTEAIKTKITLSKKKP